MKRTSKVQHSYVRQLDFKAFWQLEMQSLFGAVVCLGLLDLVI